jgi:predicted sulfurtransferase
MKQPRLPAGTSDPLTFTCTCPASTSTSGGLVLLFYRYFAANPPLPPSLEPQANEPSILTAFHTILTQELGLGGKLRIAKEGFNITVGGTVDSIEKYIQACLSHWSFSNLDLNTQEKQKLFFKPTPGGCACVFGGVPASVQVKAEITPMGVTNYLPKRWDAIESLTPEEFHERCWEKGGERVMIDVRNHYESRIGYFFDPVSGQGAVRPEIRRFSQWPLFVRRYLSGPRKGEGDAGKVVDGAGRQIMTYCTGGIRCEKGVRWMQENMERREGDTVCTLKGGIAAYLTWMDEEIKVGRKRPGDSLFRGRNYVFDARGSTGLSEEAEVEPVSTCHLCDIPSDRLSKCRSRSCHLILVICRVCEEAKDPRCCQSCSEFDQTAVEVQSDGRKAQRPVCMCERKREAELWGGEHIKFPKARRRKDEKNVVQDGGKINIQINTIE